MERVVTTRIIPRAEYEYGLQFRVRQNQITHCTRYLLALLMNRPETDAGVVPATLRTIAVQCGDIDETLVQVSASFENNDLQSQFEIPGIIYPTGLIALKGSLYLLEYPQIHLSNGYVMPYDDGMDVPELELHELPEREVSLVSQ